MTENVITEKIIGCAIAVHRELGPGLLESVYEEALCYELNQAELQFKRQQSVPIHYKGVQLKTPLRLDLIVEDKIIIDNKAKSEVAPIDKQQLLTYLRLNNVQLGLLINFNTSKLIDGIHRVANNF